MRIIILALLLTGCSSSIPLVDNFTIPHKDGYEVTVIHVANDWKAIRDNCHVSRFKSSPVGCAYMPTRFNPVCKVYSPNPKGIDDWVWLHEVGGYPGEESPIFGHCEGMQHGEESAYYN